jgi:RNA polymerase sigma factor (TIGR02999 family)
MKGEVTALLLELGHGNEGALDRLLPIVYDELRQLARAHRYAWGPGPSGARIPGTQSLVHEAYLKLFDHSQVEWHNRAQFFCLASRAMRSILIDSARRQLRQKREGERKALPLEEAMLVSQTRSEELLALDEALIRLRAESGRLADIVDCRVFGGLTVEETGDALSVSPATVKRGWNAARAWLFQAMGGSDLSSSIDG